MPYAFALLEAVLFTIGAAAATLVIAFASPFRHFFAFAWRIWLWGSIGFVVANLLLLAILFPLLNGAGIAGGPARHADFLEFVLAGLVVFGPLLFSSAGILLGCFYGWRLAWRRAAQSGI